MKPKDRFERWVCISLFALWGMWSAFEVGVWFAVLSGWKAEPIAYRPIAPDSLIRMPEYSWQTNAFWAVGELWLPLALVSCMAICLLTIRRLTFSRREVQCNVPAVVQVDALQSNGEFGAREGLAANVQPLSDEAVTYLR